MANNEWEWQDRFTFAEQLRRVADNLISTRVEAWYRRCLEQTIVYMDLNILDETLAGTDEDEMEELYDRVFAIVEGDEELTRFVEAIRTCGGLDDICD